MVNGVDRERMVFELAAGFSHLSVNMEAFENVALVNSQYGCLIMHAILCDMCPV